MRALEIQTDQCRSVILLFPCMESPRGRVRRGRSIFGQLKIHFLPDHFHL